jgi:hypothetical protein
MHRSQIKTRKSQAFSLEKEILSAPSSELGPSAPTPQASVSPPLDPKGGGGQHSLAGERMGDPIRTTGHKAWHFVLPSPPSPQQD